jgi:hypothetical protein
MNLSLSHRFFLAFLLLASLHSPPPLLHSFMRRLEEAAAALHSRKKTKGNLSKLSRADYNSFLAVNMPIEAITT